ncbi:hypothetical protein [Flavobacterium microcysteis]|uniref:Uncharacterized protein n=1 Tax=Flavobacterium microcysteis TaxID=2596891 RepID=A0A501PXX4_9FLAO|nr:hypothetical protein [Flavobacterium microcysteis]TPD65273.1 hypothetical protein FJA49_13805 [Flavobacterium microcysteis]
MINFSVYGQYTYDKSKISNKVLKVVKKIEKVNVYMGAAVGYGGMKPEQYENFEKLKEIATPKELIALTNHPNTTVRCYAFSALVSDEKLKGSIDIFKIVKDHIYDYESVSTQFGCVGSDMSVSDLFIGRVVMREDYEEDFYRYKLNNQQQREIDSLLILKKNNSYARRNAIQTMETNAQNYALLRTLVIEEKNNDALPKLAAYKKEEDLQLILDFHKTKTDTNEYEKLHAVYLAIQEFPHPIFLSLLKEEQSNAFDEKDYSEEWGLLYKLIAGYKNQEALQLLQLPFTKIVSPDIRKHHLVFMYSAIMDFPNPLYDPLLWDLWEKENISTLESINHLMDLDSKRGYKAIRKEFGVTAEIKKTNLNLDRKEFGEIEYKVELMLNLMMENEKEIAFEVISNKIRQTEEYFRLYCKYALKLKNPIFVEPLLERLRTEHRPHFYLETVRTLLDYNEDTVNTEIVKILSVNENLTEGWGGTELKGMLLEKKLIKE